MRRRRSLPVLTLALLVGLGACDDPAPTGPLLTAPDPSFAKPGSDSGSGWEVIDLGGTDASAIQLNAQGTVVGYTDYRNGDDAVYWTVDAAGTVVGPTAFAGLESVHRTGAVDVNELDQALVRDLTAGTGYVYDGLAASPVELARPTGATSVTPWSLNDDGVVSGVIGSEVDGVTVREPTVWTNPFDATVAPTTLPTLEGHSGSCRRLYVNDVGVIAGALLDETDGSCDPVVWTLEADGSITGPTPVPVEAGSEGFDPFDLNDAGSLAGALPDDRAALRDAATGDVTHLAPAGDDTRAWATGINDPVDGGPVRVAGTSGLRTADEKAVVWSIGTDGVPSDPVVLPITNSQTTVARAISDAGWVGGQITDTKGRTTTRTAALWRPTTSDGGSDDGGTDDGGDDTCEPKGPQGNNCK